jgi:saccharopine dehydrogenase (NAD+, L-lysine forming)
VKSLLIRAEDKNQWERRTPLVPDDVKWLTDTCGITTFVEQSGKRFFPIEQYQQAGAIACNDMAHGDVIIGVKEIPQQKIIEGKTYIFFSHTIKGQADNMPMLKQLINQKCTLIDYEKITDQENHRLIYFGNYAGDVGALDILWLMGEYWQNQGIPTPFLECQQAIHYHSLTDARQHLLNVGDKIRHDGLPHALTPLVVGILGYGHVSQGAQAIFDCLPTKKIDPTELPALFRGSGKDNRTIFISIFKEEHLVKRRNGSVFNLKEYFQNPELYESQFEKYLPYLTILINAVYWDRRYPRFVTWEALRRLYNQTRPKLNGIADITCDVNGSIECNVKVTNSGEPAYQCDPINQKINSGHRGAGIVVLAVDNLPTELPNDASMFFSHQLRPFIPSIVQADFTKPMPESGLSSELQKAVILYNGDLTPSFHYLKKYLN